MTISGTRFMAFDRLRSHEECRDELIIYDSVADVRDAYSNAGLKPLVVSDKILHEALDVTCRASCRRGAAKAV